MSLHIWPEPNFFVPSYKVSFSTVFSAHTHPHPHTNTHPHTRKHTHTCSPVCPCMWMKKAEVFNAWHFHLARTFCQFRFLSYHVAIWQSAESSWKKNPVSKKNAEWERKGISWLWQGNKDCLLRNWLQFFLFNCNTQCSVFVELQYTMGRLWCCQRWLLLSLNLIQI